MQLSVLYEETQWDRLQRRKRKTQRVGAVTTQFVTRKLFLIDPSGKSYRADDTGLTPGHNYLAAKLTDEPYGPDAWYNLVTRDGWIRVSGNGFTVQNHSEYHYRRIADFVLEHEALLRGLVDINVDNTGGQTQNRVFKIDDFVSWFGQ